MSREPADDVDVIRLTRAQVREVDRLAIDQYHIPGIVLMENAARAAAQVALAMLIDFRTGKALILCGGGNNGGDGLAVARHLHNHGVDVTIGLTVDPAKYAGDALINWNIVSAMKLRVIDGTPERIRAADDVLIIDAIFGTGLSAPPRDPFPAIVQAVSDTDCPVLAIDVPSGLDCDTGKPLGPAAIVADRTITFVAQKAGFGNAESRMYTGEVIVGDIGCPRELIARVIGSEQSQAR
jgi:NAD(P)H-hydrate epimerase